MATSDGTWSEYAVILSEPEHTLPLQGTNDLFVNDVSIEIVVEKSCGRDKFRHAPVIALSGLAVETLHGRRRRDVVELFCLEDKEETPHLQKQYEARGFTVVKTTFPASRLDKFHIGVTKALQDQVLSQVRVDMCSGIILGDTFHRYLTAAYASRNIAVAAEVHHRKTGKPARFSSPPMWALGTVLNNDVTLFATEDQLDSYFDDQCEVADPMAMYICGDHGMTAAEADHVAQHIEDSTLELLKSRRLAAEQAQKKKTRTRGPLSEAGKQKKKEYEARKKAKQREEKQQKIAADEEVRKQNADFELAVYDILTRVMDDDPQTNVEAHGANVTTEQHVTAEPQITSGQNITTEQHVTAGSHIVAEQNTPTEQQVTAEPYITPGQQVTAESHITPEQQVTAVPHITSEQHVTAEPHITAAQNSIAEQHNTGEQHIAEEQNNLSEQHTTAEQHVTVQDEAGVDSGEDASRCTLLLPDGRALNIWELQLLAWELLEAHSDLRHSLGL